AHNFNFRYADLDAERTSQYNIPEYLSATDSTVVVIRKVLTTYARGVHNAEELSQLEAEGGTREERLVTERNLAMADAIQSAHAAEIKEGLSQSGLQVD